jgi:hypothetical protein
VIDIKAARLDYDCRREAEKRMREPEKRGTTTWTWLCPFHKEKTASFHVYKEGFYCYGCNAHGDVFDLMAFLDKKPLADVLKGQQIDPAAELERKIAYAKWAQERLQEEIQRAETVLADLHKSRIWEKYSEQQTEWSRRWWETNGIPSFWQDWWKFGFIPQYIMGEYVTPAMTIPIFETGWDCVNIRMRLVNPPQSGDKYRPYKAGLPAPMFLSDPDKPLANKTLVCEGEKKAAVAFITADDPTLQVVGLPGKNPSHRLVEKLKDCDPVYICLDPDADPTSMAKEIGMERTRIIRLPQKIDDMILDHGLDKAWMSKLLNQARMA